jgi:hypothetical protein
MSPGRVAEGRGGWRLIQLIHHGVITSFFQQPGQSTRSEYDFENYALEHAAFPPTDPLSPQAGSVFAIGEESTRSGVQERSVTYRRVSCAAFNDLCM